MVKTAHLGHVHNQSSISTVKTMGTAKILHVKLLRIRRPSVEMEKLLNSNIVIALKVSTSNHAILIANVILMFALKISALENKKVKTVVTTSTASPTTVIKVPVKNLTSGEGAPKTQTAMPIKDGVLRVTANFDTCFPFVSKIVSAVLLTASRIFVSTKHLVITALLIMSVLVNDAQTIHVPRHSIQVGTAR